jgi:alkyl sulfatase BDS1-like metallo-beta-lactamase superfamily hydrolase
LEGRIEIDISGQNSTVSPEQAEFAKSFPIEGILKSMTVNLNPVASAGVNKLVVFVFPDQDKRFQIHVRNRVAVVRRLAAGEELEKERAVVVRVDASDWVDLVTGQKSFALALANGTISVEGGLSDTGELLSFLQLFQPE